MNLTDWLAALNQRLKDDGNALFTAAEKEAHLGAAVQEYSRCRPRVFSIELATVAGQQQYPLPADCLWVVDTALPCPAAAETALVPGASPARGWLEEAGTLWLFPVPDANGLPVRVTGAGAWSLETVPPGETEPVLIAAHARCCEVLATDTARAFAFWSGSEKFDKSEVSRHYRELARDLRLQLRRLVG